MDLTKQNTSSQIMDLTITKNDMARLNVFSQFNDLGIIFLKEGHHHVLKNSSNMIRIRLDENVPVEFGTSFKKLEGLMKMNSVGTDSSRTLGLVETSVPEQYYLKSSTAYQNTQIPTVVKKYLTTFLPNTETAFDDYVNKVEDNVVCTIVSDAETPSLFDRFNYIMYESLQIENDTIQIYQDDNGDIVIEISQKSINEGSLPSGAKSKDFKKNDHFVRSIICKADDVQGTFPKGKVYAMSKNIYSTMQRAGREFNMKLGSAEIQNTEFLVVYFYSDDIEFINVLGEVN